MNVFVLGGMDSLSRFQAREACVQQVRKEADNHSVDLFFSFYDIQLNCAHCFVVQYYFKILVKREMEN